MEMLPTLYFYSWGRGHWRKVWQEDHLSIHDQVSVQKSCKDTHPHWSLQVWAGSCAGHSGSPDCYVRPCHGRAGGRDWPTCHCTEGVEDEEGEYWFSSIFSNNLILSCLILSLHWHCSLSDPDHHPEVHARRLFWGLEYPGPDYLWHVDGPCFLCMLQTSAVAAVFLISYRCEKLFGFRDLQISLGNVTCGKC